MPREKQLRTTAPRCSPPAARATANPGRVFFAAPFLLLLSALPPVGCNVLPAGEVSAIRGLTPPPATSESTAAPDAAPPVILLRGWRDLWSEGIDRLAETLRAEGIGAAVFKQSQSEEVGDALLARAAAGGRGVAAVDRAAGAGGRVVLIGFSFGADDAIRTAARLGAVGCPVELLVLIDPVTPPPVPPNVRRCANFYQSNGAWDVFPWLRGVPVGVDPANPQRVTNVNLRDHPDLLEPGTAHRTIAANPKLHAAIVAEVRAALGRGR